MLSNQEMNKNTRQQSCLKLIVFRITKLALRLICNSSPKLCLTQSRLFTFFVLIKLMLLKLFLWSSLVHSDHSDPLWSFSSSIILCHPLWFTPFLSFMCYSHLFLPLSLSSFPPSFLTLPSHALSCFLLFSLTLPWVIFLLSFLPLPLPEFLTMILCASLTSFCLVAALTCYLLILSPSLSSKWAKGIM